jgi:hypothetical protein
VRIVTTLATLLVALLAPAAARAQLDLGVRTGWAIPAGHAFSGGDLAAQVNGAFQVQVDVGYRIVPALSVGAFASYAVGRVDPHVTADAGVDTSARVKRAGIRASLVLEGLSPALAPWAGMGAGYERAGFDVGDDFTYTGFEFVILELGADWKASQRIRVGPYVSWSLGQYDELNGRSIAAKGGHAWVTLGLRGAFGP